METRWYQLIKQLFRNGVYYLCSLDIFLDNINMYLIKNRLDTYNELAKTIKVNENTLKSWQSRKRCPSLKYLDNISSSLGTKTYLLIKPNADINDMGILCENDSRKTLIKNLNQIFMDKNKNSWNEKVSLFDGSISEDALKSYFRNDNYKTPPLKVIDKMAEALGISPYSLIMGE